jgi:hypothetical protein
MIYYSQCGISIHYIRSTFVLLVMGTRAGGADIATFSKLEEQVELTSHSSQESQSCNSSDFATE